MYNIYVTNINMQKIKKDVKHRFAMNTSQQLDEHRSEKCKDEFL